MNYHRLRHDLLIKFRSPVKAALLTRIEDDLSVHTNEKSNTAPFAQCAHTGRLYNNKIYI